MFIIIFLIIGIVINKNIYNKNKVNLKQKIELENIMQNIENELKNETKEENKTNKINTNKIASNELIAIDTKEKLKKYSWGLYIPTINLIAQIQDGTDEKTMNKYIGHFEDTSMLNGNVGLAAHNRGYPVNYFAKLKELKIGDEVIYKYENNIRKYEVIKTFIIKDTDWTNLEDTKDNILTLITCVENKPSYRRCVQCKEK